MSKAVWAYVAGPDPSQARVRAYLRLTSGDAIDDGISVDVECLSGRFYVTVEPGRASLGDDGWRGNPSRAFQRAQAQAYTALDRARAWLAHLPSPPAALIDRLRRADAADRAAIRRQKRIRRRRRKS